MYLKVQYNNSIKPYTLTDNYNKPYIKVNGSILPLTTNTTQGLHIKISMNNITYRPLEYNSMSTSDTYYTSKVDSIGLSSTTALTRSSTYDTQYYTRSSTSSTVYYTRSSTSGTNYLTKTVADNKINISHQITSRWQYTYMGIGNASSRSGGIQIASLATVGSSYRSNVGSQGNVQIQGLTVSWTQYYISTYYTLSYYATDRPSVIYTNTMSGTTASSMNAFYAVGANNTMTDSYATSYFMTAGSQLSKFNTTNWVLYHTSGQFYTQTMSVWANIITQTTGTQYLTRSSTSATSYLTRSSTYSTVYLTRSSTSGYSGVSSSSSQSSGWL